MSRAPDKFWTIIVLLVMRLALGDSAHAMTHAPDAAMDAQNVECPEHQQATPGADQPTSEPECCKHGACECPCFHTPCAIQFVSGAVSFVTSRTAPPIELTFVGLQESSDLLRPPA